MDIKEFVENKRKLEREITVYLNEKLDAFFKDTGVTYTHLDIVLCDVSTLSSIKKEFYVEYFKIKIEL